MHLDIILFDSVEAINYMVFRSEGEVSARLAAYRRARELQRMFAKVLESPGLATIVLESETEVVKSQTYASILMELRQAYAAGGPFRDDVDKQVVSNLRMRIERHGLATVERALPRLSEYVLQEMAFFESVYQKAPDTLEIYPGPNLFVKQRLWSGDYREQHLCGRPDKFRRFLDISLLAGQTSAANSCAA